jgi:hypothetical protein
VTIANDDLPQVNLSNVSVDEGNTGITNALLRFTLSPAAPFPAEVQFRTVDGTATALDYHGRAGWVRFEPGETNKSIIIPVLGDTEFELSETAAVQFIAVQDATFGIAQAFLTIRNDDLPPAPAMDETLLPDGGLRLDFPTVSGATYRLQIRTNLTTDVWRNLPNTIPGDGRPASFLLPQATGSQSYYRLSAQ